MYNLEEIKSLIDKCKWTWARTYVDVPHEYIVRGKCDLTDEEFLHIVHAQREVGIHERWGRYNFPYLHVDGYKYWTMGDTFENTIILNRQKLFNEFDSLLDVLPSYYSDEDFKIIEKAVESFGKSIFEIGCGIGRLTKSSFVNPNNYYAVEPSKRLVELFRAGNEGYYRRISNKAFEESRSKWIGSDCVIVALFGSASYVMKPYLEMIHKNKKEHLLMFYKECPIEFEETHYFKWSKEELSSIFPKSLVYDELGYYIVSSKEIDI